MSKTYFHIDKDDSVEKIQQQFSDLYPFLRITLFRNVGNGKKVNGRSAAFCPAVKMSEIKPGFHSGTFEISKGMTVPEFENKLYEQFGLSAQIARRSGNLWMEPTMTDHWTLVQQNEHGKEISPEHHEQPFRDVPYGC